MIRAVGVDTGGCNIQFAVEPDDRPDDRHRDEPAGVAVHRAGVARRPASRSRRSPPSSRSATPSTRSPTTSPRETPASFEPSLDYVVVKVPRFAFEKFPGADPTLTTHMKSVGEAMAIGRSFTEALQKALRSLESRGRAVRPGPAPRAAVDDGEACWTASDAPHDGRLQRRAAGAAGRRDRRARCTRPRGIDPWFLDQIAAARRDRRRGARAAELDPRRCCAGPSGTASPTRRSPRCAATAPRTSSAVLRHALGIRPGLQDRRHLRRRVRGAHAVPLLLLRRGDRGRAARAKPKVLILGSAGRTGSGRASSSTTPACTPAFALRDAGYETVMVNCNPETVSTDYDTCDRLYFEPLTLEDVLEVVHAEQSRAGAGRRRHRAARRPDAARRSRSGSRTPACRSSAPRPEAIHLAEDRGAFGRVLAARRAARARARHRHARSTRRRRSRHEIGYPVLVRPSYVLGGRGMEIVYDEEHAARLHRAGRPRSARSTRCSSTGSSTTPSRSTSTRSTTATSSTSAASWSTSRRPASTPATRRARCRRSPWAAATSSGSATRPGDRPRRRRPRPAQRAVRARRRRRCYVLEANPRASPDRAVRRPRRRRCRWPRRRPAS